MYENEVKDKEGKGHPDFQYSRKRLEELDIEEKRRNELIKQALDRMNHYFADRKRRIEILLTEERELNEPHEENVKHRGGEETAKTRYGFVVPLEVYLNPEYREYLNHADNLKSVKVIVDEYYRKYDRKEKSEETKKKKHWWQ